MAELTNVVLSAQRAIAVGDVEAALAHFAVDATYHVPWFGLELRGRAEIGEWLIGAGQELGLAQQPVDVIEHARLVTMVSTFAITIDGVRTHGTAVAVHYFSDSLVTNAWWLYDPEPRRGF